MPSVAGVFAVYHATQPGDLPRLYYIGFHPNVDRKLTAFDYAKSLITDTMTVVAACLTIYKAYHSDLPEVVSGWNAMWIYPTLPVALVGFGRPRT